VCGWLLPNHLNNSIAVYDAGGNPLGELLLLRKSKGKTSVQWQPAPGNPDVSAAGTGRQEVRIANQHLRNMIETMLRRDDQAAAFGNLLQVIDKTLWTSDPLGERGDQNLSVLIGRPLALVRSNLQLQLNGKPFYNQAWHETFEQDSPALKENSGGLLDLAFPIRLGSSELRNNGLVGYFEVPISMRCSYQNRLRPLLRATSITSVTATTMSGSGSRPPPRLPLILPARST
jgi:hypothetical protein